MRNRSRSERDIRQLLDLFVRLTFCLMMIRVAAAKFHPPGTDGRNNFGTSGLLRLIRACYDRPQTSQIARRAKSPDGDVDRFGHSHEFAH